MIRHLIGPKTVRNFSTQLGSALTNRKDGWGFTASGWGEKVHGWKITKRSLISYHRWRGVSIKWLSRILAKTGFIRPRLRPSREEGSERCG